MGVGNLASLTRGGNLNLMTLLLLDDFLYFFLEPFLAYFFLETFLVNFFAVFLGFADRDRDRDFEGLSDMLFLIVRVLELKIF